MLHCVAPLRRVDRRADAEKGCGARVARSSTIIFHQLLVAAAVLIPAAAFLAAALDNRRDVLRESEGTVMRTVAVLDEHARKVFDTVDLVLGRVADHASGMTNEQIATPETSRFLRELKAPLEQAVSVWIADADGRVLAGSQDWNRQTRIADRDFFAVHRSGDHKAYISRAFVGRATNIASFAVSRGRTGPDGQFAGTIHVAVSPDYFSTFFREASPVGSHSAVLFRRDGSVLARDPEPARDAAFPPDSEFMKQVAAKPVSGIYSGPSPLDGVTRFVAYRQVSPHPVYVAFGLSQATVNARWFDNLRLYAQVAASASIFLLFLSLLALRRVRAEQAALVQLRRQSELRRVAEQRLLQAQKMESIGQLTGEIAHDFNNLLTIILGNLGLLRKVVTGNERGERLVNGAIQGAERGAALTQRLLAFARRQDLAPRAVDLSALIEGLSGMIEQTAGPASRVTLAMPAGLPTVMVDPQQFEMAVLNLVSNARDSMPDGGGMTIAAAAESLDLGNDLALYPGRYVCLSVTDTGAGMDESTLARASEPFFTTKDVGKGTGLGVSIVHGLAVQSGGAFRLQSRLGEGTRAEIWLPVSDSAQEAYPQAEAAPST